MTKGLFPKENKIYRMVRKMFPKSDIISKFLGIQSISVHNYYIWEKISSE